MYLEFVIHYEKKIKSKKIEAAIAFYSKADNLFLGQFLGLMQATSQQVNELRNSTDFQKLLKIEIIENKNTIMMIKSNKILKNMSLMSFEYILNFDWVKMNRNELCKIISINFWELVITLDQKIKNTINNLAKLVDETDTEALKIKVFSVEKKNINYKIDSIKVKNPNYKTPVRYRNT